MRLFSTTAPTVRVCRGFAVTEVPAEKLTCERKRGGTQWETKKVEYLSLEPGEGCWRLCASVIKVESRRRLFRGARIRMARVFPRVYSRNFYSYARVKLQCSNSTTTIDTGLRGFRRGNSHRETRNVSLAGIKFTHRALPMRQCRNAYLHLILWPRAPRRAGTAFKIQQISVKRLCCWRSRPVQWRL